MLRQIIVAFVLLSINVSIHAAGIVKLFQWVAGNRFGVEKSLGSAGEVWLLIRILAIITFFHLVEICVWALFYMLWGGLESFETALYDVP